MTDATIHSTGSKKKKDGIRVLVTGGRDYRNKERVYSALNAVDVKYGVSAVINGGATGADELAASWAPELSEPYPADWDDLTQPGAVIRSHPYGKKYDALAGVRRNSKMLIEGKPDVVIAFPGGRGTADMVRKAKTANVPIWDLRKPE